MNITASEKLQNVWINQLKQSTHFISTTNLTAMHLDCTIHTITQFNTK